MEVKVQGEKQVVHVDVKITRMTCELLVREDHGVWEGKTETPRAR